MPAPDAGADSGTPQTKPRLKINVSRSSSFAIDGTATPTSQFARASQPGPGTPTATPGEGPRKLKLKVSNSQPPTPAEKNAPLIKTKAGRQSKPSQKLVDSKKRPHEDDDDLPLSATSKGPASTKIKIRQGPKATPTQLVLKPRGRPPMHPPGDGYDSEASDREMDPAIEEQFVLRMPPGEHCDHVRKWMEEGKIGIPKNQGGADMHLKFFEEDTHRAMVTVKGQQFAAVMVDLPTITEAMKTWDKKSFMKSADICQMLLVFQKVKGEDEARRAPLPSMIDNNFKWPHGLTPPMHDCVNRRFAKTISRKEIEDKEAEVERLLIEDGKSSSTRWEWVDDRIQDADDEDAEGEDAEGELDDYFGAPGVGEEDDNDLEADLEAAFADELMAETPATGMDMTTPMTTQLDTPAPVVLQDSIEADESEEDEDDDDDDDEDDDDLDEDQRAQRDEEQGVRDIIHDMEKQLAHRRADLAKMTNKILRTRVESQIKQLKSEIELKKSSIGLEIDD